MSYENKYKGRKTHSQSELESICEYQYEVIRKLMNLIQNNKTGLEYIRDFDEDTEQAYDDPGHVAQIQLKIIKEKISEL